MNQVFIAPTSNTRQGFTARWIDRYDATPSGIYAARASHSYNPTWVELGSLSTTVEH